MGLRKGCVFLPFKDLTYSSDFEVFFFSFFLSLCPERLSEISSLIVADGL